MLRMDSKKDYLFFSVIIPAHNEEKYIVSTLEHITNLNYPKDRIEVFVIENGSKDNTLSISKKFESENIHVISLAESGVSHAKNKGIEMVSPDSDWTILLDADTLLKSESVSELNQYLLKESSKKYSVGTTYLKPIPDSAKARVWFSFYDIGHRFTKASYAIQIARTSVLKQFRFNEKLSMGEDLELIAFCLKKGKFFIFPTKNIFTSTRRFDDEGWWRVFFIWTFVAMLPDFLKKKFSYKVVR
jgi:glycosyltransferase involved in cell wall biosynthesis